MANVAEARGERLVFGPLASQQIADEFHENLISKRQVVIEPRSADRLSERPLAPHGTGNALQLQQRENQVRQAEASLKEALARQRSLEQTHQPRDVLLAGLSERLEATLKAFGYPKVEQLRLQKNLVPVVRNRRYDLVGSSGAMTLIALAWQLTIFEMSVETGEGHPGFLLIDSPQKNLRPVSVTRALNDDESAWILADHESIVERIYGHMQKWLDEHPTAQIIVVDNEPPELVSTDIVVTYSADPLSPPYGLIHNADGSKGTAASTAAENEATS